MNISEIKIASRAQHSSVALLSEGSFRIIGQDRETLEVRLITLDGMLYGYVDTEGEFTTASAV
jgi:transcriptional regulator of aromatic amino acid metabolism